MPALSLCLWVKFYYENRLAHCADDESDLDRTNLGNARLQGLVEENLGGDPTGILFNWVNSAFFFSYVGNATILHRPSFYLLLPRLSAKFLQR
jgi:hypothetical protein